MNCMSSAYGIGPGKTVKLSKITSNQAPTPKLSSKVTEELADKFKSRSTKPVPAQPSHDESPDAPAPPKLFLCPEEGCMKSYQRYAFIPLPLYKIIWIAESMNVSWSVRPCSIKLCVVMPLDWKNGLLVFRNYVLMPKSKR